MVQDYKSTIFLPQSDFAMKANLPEKEPKILEHWQKIGLYHILLSSRKEAPVFVLHDGPPFANGHLHLGHALNKILKDTINRMYFMKGYAAPFVPGWDCHGLPIENKVEESYKKAGKSKDDISQSEFRKECRQSAEHWIQLQKQDFIRLGIQGDWDNYYQTMDYHSEAQIVENMFKFLKDGCLYRGLKPVMWSVVEKTALAEAEVEYKEKESSSIYVFFQVKSSPHPHLKNCDILIWTTTPWTLPANRAIAYGRDFDYVVVQCPHHPRPFVVAKDLLEEVLAARAITEYTILKEIKGDQFRGTVAIHPFHGMGYSFEVPLLPGDHVTTQAGTGFVHIAPSHGVEDFLLGQEYNLDLPMSVSDSGFYTDEVPYFSGKHIFKVNEEIIDELRSQGALWADLKITHSYPHSWRSKAPLIYRATSQWFISMDRTSLRKKALQSLEQITWVPKISKNRLQAMLSERPDWCVSRQRSWGVPLAFFVHKKTGEPLKDEEVFARTLEIIRQRGTDAWFDLEDKEFLGSDYNPHEYEKVKDIIDVWFESGSTHTFVLGPKYQLPFPADLYVEGSDQHRGWFQSSLLVGIGTSQSAPYKTVLTHGFLVDEQGYKLSKSKGNSLSLQEIIRQKGADILRLWVISANYMEDLKVGDEILAQQEEAYRRFRNTFRYLLGNLDGFSPKEMVSYAHLPELEQWVLHRLYELGQVVEKVNQTYDYFTLYHQLKTFCTVDLSNYYFDIRKDSLYCDHPSELTRRAVRTVLYHLFNYIVKWMAPILCFTAEEAWMARYGQEKSVHLEKFDPLPAEWKNDALANKQEKIRSLRRVITGALESARAKGEIRSSLQASVYIYLEADMGFDVAAVDWACLGITSDAKVLSAKAPPSAFRLENMAGVAVEVQVAQGEKCERCWKVSPVVGMNAAHPTLCERCSDAVERLKLNAP